MMVCNINNKDLHAIIPDWGELMAFYKKVKKKKTPLKAILSMQSDHTIKCAGQKKTKIILHSDISVI